MSSFDAARKHNSEKKEKTTDVSLHREFRQVVQTKFAHGIPLELSRKETIREWLRRCITLLGTALMDYFTANYSEISIRQSYDADGRVRWTLYDPECDRTHHFTDERSVRAWIESRYYR